MTGDRDREFAAKLTHLLGELDLGFERTVAADGFRLWNVPFAIDNVTTRIVTIYFIHGWAVALHVVGTLSPSHSVALDILRANANMPGAKAALNGDYLHVLADCPATALTNETLWTMLRAVVFAAEQLKGLADPHPSDRAAQD